MKDLKNMNAVNQQINTDKKITLAVSTLGIIMGLGATILFIDLLLG